MKRILIIGDWKVDHIKRFLNVLNQEKDENLIVDFLDTNLSETEIYKIDGINNIYRIQLNKLDQIICTIKKIKPFVIKQKKIQLLKSIFKQNHYDLINLHQIPIDAYKYIHIAHKYGIKTMLTPFGSDVLRITPKIKKYIQIAFNKTNYVTGDLSIGFTETISKLFNIQPHKLIDLDYGSNTIEAIIKIKNKYSRKDLVDYLNIPYSSYYITCGYNASTGQQQATIIKAIAKNKHFLPKDYLLIIPLTYGIEKEKLYKELKSLCEQLDIKATFITQYLSVEQVASLRLITDLFIHIQITDAYNASLQEFLLAGTECINGKWLEYPTLTHYGNPYHICNDTNSLAPLIKEILCRDVLPPKIDIRLIQETSQNTWSNRILAWKQFYSYLK